MLPRKSKSQPTVATQDVYYEIFVRSFADSNGDGIGDLNGITAKLDYLKDLGISGLWLTPFNPSPSYHKYDVTDYREVDREYGTLDDFRRLVREAHNRGIKILMDLVVNHTSTQHPWFLKAIENDPKYHEYYVWSADSSGKNWFVPKGGSLPKKEKYFGFFSPGMPDLNYDNPVVRREIIDIGKWWLQNTGIDGYRLDAAQHIYEPTTPKKNADWWMQFTDSLKRIKPDLITIGEVWNVNKNIAVYLGALSGSFNFELSWGILKALQKAKSDSLIEKLLLAYNIYGKNSSAYLDPIFLSNHDGDRIISELKDSVARAKLAAAIYLTLPGTPFIYYGEELGMRGKKPDEEIREPFLWGSSSSSFQTSWEKSKNSTPSAVDPVDVQEKDKNSMLNFYKGLIKLRKKNSALTSGVLLPVKFDDQKILGYIRIDSRQSLLIIHNLSARQKIIELPSGLQKFKHRRYTSVSEVKFSKNKVDLPPYSSIILKL